MIRRLFGTLHRPGRTLPSGALRSSSLEHRQPRLVPPHRPRSPETKPCGDRRLYGAPKRYGAAKRFGAVRLCGEVKLSGEVKLCGAATSPAEKTRTTQ